MLEYIRNNFKPFSAVWLLAESSIEEIDHNWIEKKTITILAVYFELIKIQFKQQTCMKLSDRLSYA